MKAKPGNSYYIYGKMNDMKRMRPMSGDHFTYNIIHAEVFTPQDAEACERLDRELAHMQTQGEFELRMVKGL